MNIGGTDIICVYYIYIISMVINFWGKADTHIYGNDSNYLNSRLRETIDLTPIALGLNIKRGRIVFPLRSAVGVMLMDTTMATMSISWDLIPVKLWS